MSYMYQLPKTGDWILIQNMTSVSAHPKYSAHGYNGTFPPRVQIIVSGISHEIPCDSYEEAVRIRDQIATIMDT